VDLVTTESIAGPELPHGGQHLVLLSLAAFEVGLGRPDVEQELAYDAAWGLRRGAYR
jgi:hypothetical protein